MKVFVTATEVRKDTLQPFCLPALAHDVALEFEFSIRAGSRQGTCAADRVAVLLRNGFSKHTS